MTALYEQSVPFLINGLNALSKFLKKAEAQATERKYDPSVVLGLRLAPDMFNLCRQVQITCDFAKNITARCTGTAPIPFPDEEKTFDELQARIAKVIELLKAQKPAEYDANREITLKVGGQDMTFKALTFLNGFALPNFYFHMTTAYNIMRANGFALGKADFMGRG